MHNSSTPISGQDLSIRIVSNPHHIENENRSKKSSSSKRFVAELEEQKISDNTDSMGDTKQKTGNSETNRGRQTNLSADTEKTAPAPKPDKNGESKSKPSRRPSSDQIRIRKQSDVDVIEGSELKKKDKDSTSDQSKSREKDREKVNTTNDSNGNNERRSRSRESDVVRQKNKTEDNDLESLSAAPKKRQSLKKAKKLQSSTVDEENHEDHDPEATQKHRQTVRKSKKLESSIADEEKSNNHDPEAPHKHRQGSKKSKKLESSLADEEKSDDHDPQSLSASHKHRQGIRKSKKLESSTVDEEKINNNDPESLNAAHKHRQGLKKAKKVESSIADEETSKISISRSRSRSTESTKNDSSSKNHVSLDSLITNEKKTASSRSSKSVSSSKSNMQRNEKPLEDQTRADRAGNRHSGRSSTLCSSSTSISCDSSIDLVDAMAEPDTDDEHLKKLKDRQNRNRQRQSTTSRSRSQSRGREELSSHYESGGRSSSRCESRERGESRSRSSEKLPTTTAKHVDGSSSGIKNESFSKNDSSLTARKAMAEYDRKSVNNRGRGESNPQYEPRGRASSRCEPRGRGLSTEKLATNITKHPDCESLSSINNDSFPKNDCASATKQLDGHDGLTSKAVNYRAKSDHPHQTEENVEELQPGGDDEDDHLKRIKERQNLIRQRNSSNNVRSRSLSRTRGVSRTRSSDAMDMKLFASAGTVTTNSRSEEDTQKGTVENGDITDDEHLKRLKERQSIQRQKPSTVARSRSLSRTRGIARSSSSDGLQGINADKASRGRARTRSHGDEIDWDSHRTRSKERLIKEDDVANGHDSEGSEAEEIDSEEESEKQQTSNFLSFLKFANASKVKSVDNSKWDPATKAESIAKTDPTRSSVSSSSGLSRLFGIRKSDSSVCPDDMSVFTTKEKRQTMPNRQIDKFALETDHHSDVVKAQSNRPGQKQTNRSENTVNVSSMRDKKQIASSRQTDNSKLETDPLSTTGKELRNRHGQKQTHHNENTWNVNWDDEADLDFGFNPKPPTRKESINDAVGVLEDNAKTTARSYARAKSLGGDERGVRRNKSIDTSLNGDFMAFRQSFK